MTRYIRVSSGGVARRVKPAITPTDHHTFPTSNVRIGQGALPEATVTGDYNTATGADALTALIGGHSNVAVGESAMIGSTNAVYNVAVGRDALGDATSSSYNVAIGYLSMNDTGNTVAYHVAIGVEAGEFVQGDGTVAVGAFALMGSFGAGATADGTVAVGYETLLHLTTGAGMVAVGYQALDSPAGTAANKTTTGSRQTALGYQTGQASATQRDDAVAVGYQALFDANNTVALGSGAQALHENAVALGQGIATTAASQVAIGLTHWEVGETTAPGTPAAGYVRVYANSNSLWTIDEAGVSTDLINAVGSHTVASHSDTTATGAELETLTDGSNADSLHAHATISSSYSHSLLLMGA